LNLLSFSIRSADVFDHSRPARQFQILDTVPNVVPSPCTPATDRETRDNSPSDVDDHIVEGVDDNPAAVDTIPSPNPDDSGESIVPNTHTQRELAGPPNEEAHATDPITASLRISSHEGDVASTSEQDARNPAASATPDPSLLAINTKSANEKRYQRAQKMVPGTALTVRYDVHTPHQSHATNCPRTGRNLCAIEWCKTHPEGTLGEFNRYYDNLLPAEFQVCPWSLVLHPRTTTLLTKI
jgi:hypothetical protein